MQYKICAIYFIPFYLVPILLYYTIGGHSNFINFDLNYSYYIFVVLSCISIVFFYSAFNKISFSKLTLINIYRPNFIWLLISFAVLPLALYFKVSYGLTFRQTGEGLSEAGAIPKLIFIIKPVFTAYTAYHFFSGDKQTKQVDITLLNILLFFLFTISSSFEALLVVLLVLRVFFKKVFLKLIVTDSISSSIRRFFAFMKLAIIGFVALASIIFMGITNKVGIDESIEYFSNSEVTSKLGYYLYYRVSIYNSSLAIALDSEINISDNVTMLEILRENIAYRAKILAGIKPIRPELTNLNRVNYIKIHYLTKDKEVGASPGVFATFLSIFPYPLAVIFCGAYLAFLGGLLSKFKPKEQDKEFSWIAAVFIYYLMFTFLHSPINNMFSIGPEPIKFFLYLTTFLLIVQKNQATQYEPRRAE